MHENLSIMYQVTFVPFFCVCVFCISFRILLFTRAISNSREMGAVTSCMSVGPCRDFHRFVNFTVSH